MKSVKVLNEKNLSKVYGGKDKYYGNGLYCNSKSCHVNWGQTAGCIANGIVASLAKSTINC